MGEGTHTRLCAPSVYIFYAAAFTRYLSVSSLHTQTELI